MLHMYQYALYYYKSAAALRPSDGRMWCAVGNCLCRFDYLQSVCLTDCCTVLDFISVRYTFLSDTVMGEASCDFIIFLPFPSSLHPLHCSLHVTVCVRLPVIVRLGTKTEATKAFERAVAAGDR